MRVVRFVVAISAVSLLGAGLSAAPKPVVPSPSVGPDPDVFQKAVSPILSNTCQPCHNAQVSSGGLNLVPYLAPSSLVEGRDMWEVILRRLRAGEMPPRGVPRPPQTEIEALVGYLESEFEKADRGAAPDPGRVTARRLNRSEYSNTVRDLLGVNFHAENDFPTDDSSYGFDTIGSVLSISPVLMEKYLSAAEKIASAAVGVDPLPKPFTSEARASNRTLLRVNPGGAETLHRFDFDADYSIAVRVAGFRPPEAQPLAMGVSIDGTLQKTFPIASTANPETEQEVTLRVFLMAGDHVVRAAPIDDAYGRSLSRRDSGDAKLNKFPQAIAITGPFPPQLRLPVRRKLFVCNPRSGAACVERIVAGLARRAYRRPVSKGEVAALLKFVRLARADGQSPEQGIQLAIQAMLVSPNFLFRIERGLGTADDDGLRKLSALELASRLSYFLWSSMPDDELLRAAEAGTLASPATLHAQVARMLADPKASALGANFAGQWLEIRNLEIRQPDSAKFPEWGPDLRDEMRTETRMFFDYILRQNRPLSDFLDARYTFLNEGLAAHYGISGVVGTEFRKVELTGDQRGGLLGQASVLTVSSYPTRTSVVLRGKYVLENILGTPPPPPPPDVPALDEGAVGTSASLRQQMEKHRSNAVCSSCHSKMDPLGFGLENYDAVGKWRTMDGNFPVDASGTLPSGRSFTSPTEMRAILMADLPNFARCITEKLLVYALGRGLEPFDRRTVKEIDLKAAADGYRFQSLVYGVVDSIAFQMRHGEPPPPERLLKTTVKTTVKTAKTH